MQTIFSGKSDFVRSPSTVFSASRASGRAVRRASAAWKFDGRPVWEACPSRPWRPDGRRGRGRSPRDGRGSSAFPAACRRGGAGRGSPFRSRSDPPGPPYGGPPPPDGASPDASTAAAPAGGLCRGGSSPRIPAPWSGDRSPCTTCRWTGSRGWGRSPGPAPADGPSYSKTPPAPPRRRGYTRDGSS